MTDGSRAEDGGDVDQSKTKQMFSGYRSIEHSQEIEPGDRLCDILQAEHRIVKSVTRQKIQFEDGEESIAYVKSTMVKINYASMGGGCDG